MQGNDVVLLENDGPNFGVHYCQGWNKKASITIPVTGGSSFSWRIQEDTILPETGRKSSDNGAGEREKRHAFQWGIRPITDPLLRIRAAYTEREHEVRQLRQRIANLEKEMTGLLAAFEIVKLPGE